MSRASIGVLVGMLWCAGITGLFAQAEDALPPTTLSVYQQLTGEALGQMLGALHVPDSLKVSVSVEPADAYWYIEAALLRDLRKSGMQPIPAGGSWRLQCAVKEANVRYANIRRDGLLGARVVDRTVTLALWLRVSDREQSAYLADTEWRSQRTDTIDVAHVEKVEHPEIAATRGVVPSEGFFSSWLEPLIMVGAVGVAIFLLFTTRS